MPMLARGYPRPNGGGGLPSGGTFGTGGGPSPLPIGIPTGLPMPSNDNLPIRKGRSPIPKLRIRGLPGGNLPISTMLRLLEWWANQPGTLQPTDVNTDGWVLECGTGTGPSLNYIGGCPPGPQLIADTDWNVGVVRIGVTNTYVMNFYGPQGLQVDIAGVSHHWGTQISRWSRTITPTELPLTAPGVIPARPLWPGKAIPWMPHIDPERIPIAQPVPDPVPIPYWFIPYRVASPGHSNKPARGPLSPRWVTPDPRYARNPGPTFVWKFDPSAGPNQQPKVQVKPGKFVKTGPPGPGTKERKFVIHNQGQVARVFSVATEVIDAIEALYEALPPELRKRPKRFVGWKGQAEAVYHHWDRINWNTAWENLVANEIEDRIVGKLGKGGKVLAQKTGRNAGFTLGPAL